MGPRISWIIFGFTFLVSQNVFSRKIDPSRKKGVTVEPGKKTIIGNIDLKKLSQTVKPEDCRDVGKQCTQEVENDSCLLNFDYMFEKCKLTCRFCSKGKKTKKCKDLNPKCRQWSRGGDCLHYISFMKDNCKRSCQLCGPENRYTDNDERCRIWGRRGICSLKRRQMLKLCPYSCNKYRRRHIPVLTIPHPMRSRFANHTPAVLHAVRPTQAPTPEPTEEERDNNNGAKEERIEEEKTRMKEQQEQEKEKSEVRLPPTQLQLTVPTTVGAPTTSQGPQPIPAPATQPAPIPAPALVPTAAQYPQDDANSEAEKENETGEVEANDGTNDGTNSGIKKAKSKLLIVIGESKRHLKKRRTTE